VQEAVREVAPEAGLERGEQIQLAAVVATVVRTAERHDTVRVLAASERARHQVRRVDRPSAAYQAGQLSNLVALRRRGRLIRARRKGVLRGGGAERRRAPRRASGARWRSSRLRRIPQTRRRDYWAAACRLASPSALAHQLGDAVEEPVADPAYVDDRGLRHPPGRACDGADRRARRASASAARRGSPTRRAAARAS
jgi:hypothetical protein